MSEERFVCPEGPVERADKILAWLSPKPVGLGSKKQSMKGKSGGKTEVRLIRKANLRRVSF